MDEQTQARATPPRRRKRAACIVAGLLVLGLGTAFVALRGHRFTVALTESQIQQRLDAIFPIDKSYLVIFDLTLSNPQVTLEDGADRLSFGLDTTLNLNLSGRKRTLTGSGTITAGLRYDPRQHAFFLDDPEIERLEILGIPIKYVDKVNQLARKLAAERIRGRPIYTLKPHEIKQAVARTVLKDVVVEDGKLVITLGL